MEKRGRPKTMVTIDGNRFKMALKRKSISQEKLANEIGWYRENLNKCINKNEMDPYYINLIGEYLDIAPDYLKGLTQENINGLKNTVLLSEIKKITTLMKMGISFINIMFKTAYLTTIKIRMLDF